MPSRLAKKGEEDPRRVESREGRILRGGTRSCLIRCLVSVSQQGRRRCPYCAPAGSTSGRKSFYKGASRSETETGAALNNAWRLFGCRCRGRGGVVALLLGTLRPPEIHLLENNTRVPCVVIGKYITETKGCVEKASWRR